VKSYQLSGVSKKEAGSKINRHDQTVQRDAEGELWFLSLLMADS
jgi:hypothetical protein